MKRSIARLRVVVAALLGLLVAVALAASPAGASAVVPTNLPTPVVHGPVVIDPHVTYWVPRVNDADSCLHPSLGFGDRPCFGYVDVGARLRGLRPGALVSADFTLHYSESFVCTDWTTLAKDQRPDRRVTLHGDGTTEGTYLAGPGPVTTSSWGRATVSAHFFAHSPNLIWPDVVDLPCGPGEAVERSALVLSDVTAQAYLENPRGDDIGDYPAVAVPGTYTASPYDFAPGQQPFEP